MDPSSCNCMFVNPAATLVPDGVPWVHLRPPLDSTFSFLSSVLAPILRKVSMARNILAMLCKVAVVKGFVGKAEIAHCKDNREDLVTDSDCSKSFTT